MCNLLTTFWLSYCKFTHIMRFYRIMRRAAVLSSGTFVVFCWWLTLSFVKSHVDECCYITYSSTCGIRGDDTLR